MLEERARRRHEAEGEVLVDRLEVDVARQQLVHEQPLELRGEGHARAHLGPVEGLDPELVAHQVERPGRLVPDRDAEDAVEALDERGAELLVEVRDHLAVAVRTQPVAAPLEPAPQLELVVDLAVEHDCDVAALVEERLVAVLGIDDRETPHAERHALGRVVALPVRAAVRERRGHRAHELRIRAAAGRVDARYPAHRGLRRPGAAVACNACGSTPPP